MNEKRHATKTNGRNIQRDASGGQGHAWRDVDPDDLPSQVREEIEAIDGDRDDYEASNGQHYRWTAAQQHANETENERDFLSGFAAGLGCQREEAEGHWAAYSRQLSDRQIAAEEQEGYERGVELGRECASL